jgi:UDP-N-acetylmuramoyl-tripeptide--D-alanyl-D-alanine ligase
MKAAIDVLMDYKPKNGRAIAIIGDMLEMGNNTEKYHVEVGEYIAKSKKIDYLIAVGESARYYTVGAQNSGMEKTTVYHFTNNEMAGKFLKNMLRAADVLLVKGSRGMVMEEIVHLLERS